MTVQPQSSYYKFQYTGLPPVRCLNFLLLYVKCLYSLHLVYYLDWQCFYFLATHVTPFVTDQVKEKVQMRVREKRISNVKKINVNLIKFK